MIYISSNLREEKKSMLTIYLSPSCTSCRKAHAWLLEYDIPFIERNIIKQPPNKIEINEILSLTEKGTEDIISTRSKAFQDLKINMNDLTMHELYELINDHPEILRKPILIDERRIQIGYNESEIRQFVPREVRETELKEAREQIKKIKQIEFNEQEEQ